VITEEVNKKYVYSSGAIDDPRLGNLLRIAPSFENEKSINEFLQKENPSTVFFGYPDDHGIKINNGRVGAALGPDHVRSLLYKMSPALNFSAPTSLLDLGNLAVNKIPFEKRHATGSEIALMALRQKHRWMGVGGGHDYGFSEGRALIEFSKAEKKGKPLIINFDAHLDVRSTDQGFNSGTPFYRLLHDYKNEFDFAEIAVQPQCNSQKHLDWVRSQGAKVILLEEIMDSDRPLDIYIKSVLDSWISQERLTYLSIDIDAFSSSVAMGASQSWPTGLLPHQFFNTFRDLIDILDVRVLGVYEVSPPLDSCELTSKLAAQIIHQFIYGKKFDK